MKLNTKQNRNPRATAEKGLRMVWAAALLALVQLTAVAQSGRILVTPDGRVLGGPGGTFILAAPVPPAGNAAPVASALTVSGTPTVGQQLTVSFTYTDADSDPAGTHQYQWYRANDATGTGQAAISSATASTYTLVAADEGKYITAGVTPVANAGTSPGAEVIGSTYTGPVATNNTAPVASAVTVSGTPTVGQQLTVSFTYTDAEGNPAGAHQYQWYSANDATGTGRAAISGATASTYTLTAADEGKYITAGVTPVASAGTSPGAEVIGSTYTGPVAAGFVCGSSLTVTHVADGVSPVAVTITYGTVQTSLTGSPKCWITQNLGATQQATSASDNTAASAGWYWQFNRMQGYAHDGTNRTPSTTWITVINDNGSWQAANDPCSLLLGSNWRLPTGTEWTDVDNNGGWTNGTKAYASTLKIHAAGVLRYNNGAVTGRGGTFGSGLYWSSTSNVSTMGYHLSIDIFSSTCSLVQSDKTYGGTVRCITK